MVEHSLRKRRSRVRSAEGAEHFFPPRKKPYLTRSSSPPTCWWIVRQLSDALIAQLVEHSAVTSSQRVSGELSPKGRGIETLLERYFSLRLLLNRMLLIDYSLRINLFLLESHFARNTAAAIAQLGERKTEDLKVTGSIPVRGRFHFGPLLIIHSALTIFT